MKQLIRDLEKKYVKEDLPKFAVGDTIDVHFRIHEENKTRIQVFSGIVIGKKGQGLGKTFTVRHVSYGEGVERVFPLHSPLIEKISVKKHGKVRRAKLYYLRGKKGKKAVNLKEKIVQRQTESE